MLATFAEIYAFARRDRYGRFALAVVWLGAYLLTAGLSHIWLDMRRHPLT